MLAAWINKDQDVLSKEMSVKAAIRAARAIQEQSTTLTPKYYEMKQRAEAAAAELEVLKQKVRAKVEGTFKDGKRLELVAQLEKAQDEVRRLELLDQSTADHLVEFKDFKDLGEKQVTAKLTEQLPQDSAIKRCVAEIDQIDAAIMKFRADLDAPDRVRVWQKAEVPTKKDIRKQAAISGVAGLAGLGLHRRIGHGV